MFEQLWKPLFKDGATVPSRDAQTVAPQDDQPSGFLGRGARTVQSIPPFPRVSNGPCFVPDALGETRPAAFAADRAQAEPPSSNRRTPTCIETGNPFAIRRLPRVGGWRDGSGPEAGRGSLRRKARQEDRSRRGYLLCRSRVVIERTALILISTVAVDQDVPTERVFRVCNVQRGCE